MANGGHGIFLEAFPSNNIVAENNVTLNKGHGVFLGGFGGGGSNNVVTMNNIKDNNGNGIALESSFL
jgi:polygalacturonase